jgi:hypothetical protein
VPTRFFSSLPRCVHRAGLSLVHWWAARISLLGMQSSSWALHP